MASFPPRGASMPARSSSMQKPRMVQVDVSQIAPPAPFQPSDEVPRAADQAPAPQQQGHGVSYSIREWTPTALMLSYFVFSISLYTLLNDTATKVFWFLYLTIATLVAGVTALEAYDGLTPLAGARKAAMKLEQSNNKFKTPDDDLPPLELIIDLNYDESNGPRDFDFLKHVRNNLFYPTHKVRVNLLCREFSTAHALANNYDHQLELAGVRICPIPAHACTSLSARMSHFINLSGSPGNAIVAIYSAGQRPHPHSVRTAIETLLTSPSISVLQGRSIAVPATRSTTFLSLLSTLEHDTLSALLRPGRAITWCIPIATDTNTYWRVSALQSASRATANTTGNGWDLGWMAFKQNGKVLIDMSVVAYEPCPQTVAAYIGSRAEWARGATVAMGRYLRLAFQKHSPALPKSEGEKNAAAQDGKWAWKTRISILYLLLVGQITAHAIVQYFCLAVAMLAVRTPTSVLDFAYTIYFPYPISEWFMVGGLVCLVSTVFMIYSARSEFVPLWTAPFVLMLYPLFLAWRACLEVFAQFEVLVG